MHCRISFVTCRCYEATVKKIQTCIGSSPIWISVDETTDACGRYITNFIVGALSPTQSSTPFLLNTEALSAANHSTIAKFVVDSLNILWPARLENDKVLLFLSDAAPYMVKSGKALCVLFPKMVHVTCLAHAIHRVAEDIRDAFPTVDKLIATVKKVFVKAPYRVLRFKEMAPGVPLPPEPILTRWGTWIKAALYYAQHFEVVSKVIMDLDAEAAAAISAAQELVQNGEVRNNLIYIAANFHRIPESITKLETQGVALCDSLSVIESLRVDFDSGCGDAVKRANQKLQKTLEKNSGYEVMKTIAAVLEGKVVEAPEGLDLSDVAAYKFAPASSADVERSFSRFKNLLSDRRRLLTVEHIKWLLVIYANTDL